MSIKELSVKTPSELLGEKKELTSQQKGFIVGEKQKLFYDEFNKRTKELKIPKEELPINFKRWLILALSQVPYKNVFPTGDGMEKDSQYLETYNEMCTLHAEDMEWGIIQKGIHMILGVSPTIFEIDESVILKAQCIHSTKDSLKYCPICDGEGYIQGETKPVFSKEYLSLLTYNDIVQKCKKLNIYISSQITKIENESISHVWYNILTSTERHNFNCLVSGKNLKNTIIT